MYKIIASKKKKNGTLVCGHDCGKVVYIPDQKAVHIEKVSVKSVFVQYKISMNSISLKYVNEGEVGLQYTASMINCYSHNYSLKSIYCPPTSSSFTYSRDSPNDHFTNKTTPQTTFWSKQNCSLYFMFVFASLLRPVSK